jgi:hypothetical protein
MVDANQAHGVEVDCLVDHVPDIILRGEGCCLAFFSLHNETPIADGIVRQWFFDMESFKDATIRGQLLDNWPVLKSVLAADKVIDVPIAKEHGMTIRFSSCPKNLFGIVGGDRGRLHWQLEAVSASGGPVAADAFAASR